MSETDPYAAPEASAEKVELSTDQEAAQEENKVPKGTVHEVLDWVGDDKDRAQAALDAEKEGAERVTLISALEEILDKK